MDGRKYFSIFQNATAKRRRVNSDNDTDGNVQTSQPETSGSGSGSILANAGTRLFDDATMEVELSVSLNQVLSDLQILGNIF